MSDTVTNRYRDALGRALPAERFRAEVTGRVLQTVQDALARGAWVSTTADRFAATCQDQQRRATSAGNAALGDLTSRHTREPAHVEPSDWRARFSG